MQPETTRHDSLPWYRQFWPWFLIGLPASVVVAGLATLLIANRHADDLVVDEYYRDGLAINRQLERKKQAEAMGLAARLRLSAGAVLVELAGPADNGTLILQLSHPLQSARDFSLTLRRTAPGIYEGPLPQRVAPRWHWILTPEHGEQWRLDGSLAPDDFDDAGPG